jgi:DNA-binding NarL/FixJ family response regulator
MLPIYVMIVDSDPRFLEIATQFLQKREGVLVYSAVTNSNEVLNQVQVFEPDVILYNLGNADPKSLETISKLRALHPKMSIIVLAPPESQEFKQAALEAGANDFVARHSLNLEFLPAIWSLVSMYQHRYGKYGVGMIPPNQLDNAVIPPAPKVRAQRAFIH